MNFNTCCSVIRFGALFALLLAVAHFSRTVNAVSINADESEAVPHGHYCAQWGTVRNIHLDVLTNTTFHISCQIFLSHINCPDEAYLYNPLTRKLEMPNYHQGGCLYDALTPFRGLMGDFTFGYSPLDNVIMTHSNFGYNNMTACAGESEAFETKAE